MEPDTLARFKALAQDYKDATGRTVQVNSAFRSLQEQARLYAANPAKAAPPGRSMHNYGYALDIQSEDADRMDTMGLLRKHGFHRPLLAPWVRNKEPWHIERAGLNYAKIRAAGGPAIMVLLGLAALMYVLTRRAAFS
jgi:hypothetical protein